MDPENSSPSYKLSPTGSTGDMEESPKVVLTFTTNRSSLRFKKSIYIHFNFYFRGEMKGNGEGIMGLGRVWLGQSKFACESLSNTNLKGLNCLLTCFDGF